MPQRSRNHSNHTLSGTTDERRRPARRTRVLTTFVALSMLVGTVIAAGVQQPAFAGDGGLIVGWMFTPPSELDDPDVRDCRSLVSFRPDGTGLTKIVDCNDNDLGITSVQNLAVSPERDRIAFTGVVPGRRALFIVGIDGSGLDELCIPDVTCDATTPDPFDVEGVQVSWGSNGLLYVAINYGSRVMVLSLESGTVADIDWSGKAEEVLGLALSPDGSSVIFHNWSNVYIAPADDIGNYELLTRCWWPCHAVWHPSGEGVLYSVNLQDPTDEETQSIAFATADPDSPNPVEYVRQTGVNLVTTWKAWLHSPSASPDGTRLVVGSWLNGGIYVVEISDSQVIDLGDVTPLFTPYYAGNNNRVSAGGFQWVGSTASRTEPPAPGPTVAVSCGPLPLQAGATVTCTVTGGDPGIDILWRASYNPTIAEAGVTLDADGTGSFTFTVPAEARGQEIMVELVEWTAPMTIGVAGGLVPSSIPAGEGRDSVPASLMVAAGLVLVVGVAVRRRGALTIG
jgi:hypothetical protein